MELMPHKKKILLIDAPHPLLKERLLNLGYEVHPHYDTPKEEIQNMLPGYFGVVMRSRIPADRAFIDAAENLAFIAREGVGTEHIEVDYAESKGIRVLISPEGSRDTVAEHALGLLLSLMNNLSRADRQVRQGEWIREGNRGVEIKGKTVGILGYGNMGTALAQRLAGFQCRVIAFDKYKKDYGDRYAAAVDLETLWRESDILSLHIPYMESNHHFVDGDFIDRFRKPIYLVNTARGLVLHTADLVERLQNGHVRGAALDVLEYEEGSFNFLDFDSLPEPFHYLQRADNVVLSPHIAGWSVESKAGHGRVLADKIEGLFGRGC